jgi:hypothetical protein
MITRQPGPLYLAKMIGDNPAAYSVDQLRGALPRLIAAKHRSRRSERALERAERRIAQVHREIQGRTSAA